MSSDFFAIFKIFDMIYVDTLIKKVLYRCA